MKKTRIDTLTLGLETAGRAPVAGERWAFLNAHPLPGNPAWMKQLVCEQDFKPVFDQLVKAGCKAEPELPADTGSFDGVLLLPCRVRARNEIDLARAWALARPGAMIAVAGANNTGIKSLRKHASGIAEIAGSLSKHHAVAFWMFRDECDWPQPAQTRRNAEYRTAPGTFSADAPDPGSASLAGHFNGRIGGKVADLGAGWGYLSLKLLERSGRVESLDLYEASWRALEAAEANLKDQTDSKLRFHWADVTTGLKQNAFDWVIMNPPFHAGLEGGRQARPEIGREFIAQAASALAPGGRLLMVANKRLPYEKTLTRHFQHITVLADEQGYKVIEAVR